MSMPRRIRCTVAAVADHGGRVYMLDLAPQTKQQVTLVYGARTPALFLFSEMILSQLAAMPGFQVKFFAETPAAEFTRQMAAHPKTPLCLTGRISVDAILRPPSSALCPLPSVFCLLPFRPPGDPRCLGRRPAHRWRAAQSNPHRRLGVTMTSTLCPPSSVLCP